jgi:hypothetical protein
VFTAAKMKGLCRYFNNKKGELNRMEGELNENENNDAGQHILIGYLSLFNIEMIGIASGLLLLRYFINHSC